MATNVTMKAGNDRGNIRKAFVSKIMDRQSKNLLASPEELPEYTIEVHDHGMLVIGHSIAAEDFEKLAKIAKAINPKWDQLAPGIASSFEALFAITSKKNIPIWSEIADRKAKRLSKGNDVRAWLGGSDTGLSSIQIVAALTGDSVAESKLLGWGKCYPHDPSDLGRCIRLLEKFPEFHSRLDELKPLCPQWSALVDRWDDLEAVYNEELEDESLKGDAPKTYKLMQEILKAHD